MKNDLTVDIPQLCHTLKERRKQKSKEDKEQGSKRKTCGRGERENNPRETERKILR